MGANGALFVVSPGVTKESWQESPWSKLLPELDPSHRIPSTADEFLDQLGGAYVLRVFSDLTQALAGEPKLLGAVETVRSALGRCSSLQVLQWARSCAVPRPVPARASCDGEQAFPQALRSRLGGHRRSDRCRASETLISSRMTRSMSCLWASEQLALRTT